VTPDELHIDDSDYWEQLYSQTARYDKYEWLAGRFGNNSSVFTTSNHELHRIRRAVLNPLFSRRSILNFQPVIRQKVDLLCEVFAKYKDSGLAFDINKAWSAFAGDIICEYAFGFGYNHLESPDFETSFHACFMALCQFSNLALQFPLFSSVSLSFITPDTSLNRQFLRQVFLLFYSY
jgi:cytochrome P450